MKGIWTLCFILLGHALAFPQSIDIDQSSQFLKPRLRLDSRYFSSFNQDQNHLSYTEGQALLTIPVNSRIKSDFKEALLDFSSLKALKENVRLRFSQQMISARLGYKSLILDTGLNHQYNCLNGSIGLTGLHSLKKLNILFYSASVAFSESQQTLSNPKISINGLIGNVKLININQYYVYGTFLSYFNSRLLPVPFIGAGFPLGKKQQLNIILPAVINYSYRATKTIVTTSLGFEGFRNGITNNSNYYTFSFGGLSACQSIRVKLKKWIWLRLDAGLVLKNRIRIKGKEYKTVYELPTGYFGNIGLHYNFGNTVLKQLNFIDLL